MLHVTLGLTIYRSEEQFCPVASIPRVRFGLSESQNIPGISYVRSVRKQRAVSFCMSYSNVTHLMLIVISLLARFTFYVDLYN